MGKVLVGPMLLALLMFGCQDEATVYPAYKPPADEPTPPPLTGNEDTFQAGATDALQYRILFPIDYNPAKRYPLHLFLHGIGERGSDNESQLRIGGAFFLADSVRSSYPAFIVFPQCPEDEFWFNKNIIESLRVLINTLTAGLSVDTDSISIGGFSMGAFGTFAMVASFPNQFVAAAAISGDGEPVLAPTMSRPTWQLFAGGRDEIVPALRTQQMAQALSEAGAEVTFTLYPEATHQNTWRYAFADPHFFNRLFKPGSESN